MVSISIVTHPRILFLIIVTLLLPFMDFILYESYKYALHAFVFLILDIKVVSVSFSTFSSQFSSLAYLLTRLVFRLIRQTTLTLSYYSKLP